MAGSRTRWWVVLAGLILSVVSLFVFGLSLKWVIAYFSIISLIFLAFFVRDIRLFCLGFFIFSIPLYIQNNIWAFPDYKVLIDGTLISPAFGESVVVLLSDLPLLVLVLLWFGSRVLRTGEKVWFPKSSLAVLLFLGWALLTFVKSRSLILSSLSFIYFVKYFVIFLYLANNIRTRKDVQVVAAMLVLGVVIQGAVCFAQWKLGVSMTALGKSTLPEEEEYLLYRAEDEIFRATGTIGISNVQAVYFEMVLPVVLCLTVMAKRPLRKILLLACLLVGVFGLVICFSKAGWGGLLGTTIIVFILLRWGGLISFRFAAAGVSAMLILALAGLFYVMGSERLLGRESLRTRPGTYGIAFRIIKKNPILGVGLNNSTAVQWQDEYDPYDESIRFAADGTVFPIHNYYLILASEVGLVGFVFFMWFILAHLKKALQLIKSTGGLAAFVAIGFTAGICGFLSHSLVDVCSSGVILSLLFIYAGMICAVERISLRDSRLQSAGDIQANREP